MWLILITSEKTNEEKTARLYYFISQLFLALLALAYTVTPSTFADNFNCINQRLAGGMYRAIKLNDKQGQYNFSLAPYINLTVATTNSQVKNINLICRRPEQTLEKCIRSTAWIGSAVDSQFNQVNLCLWLIICLITKRLLSDINKMVLVIYSKLIKFLGA